MGRIRSYRPDLWDDERFASLTPDAQLCLFRLMSHVSDKGRIRCVPNFLLGRLYPNGERSREDLTRYLCELLDGGFVLGYSVGGRPYLEVAWHAPTCPVKQVISRPTPCTLPGSDDPLAEPLHEWLHESVRESFRERLFQSSFPHSMSDSMGTGRDWTGPEGTVRSRTGQSFRSAPALSPPPDAPDAGALLTALRDRYRETSSSSDAGRAAGQLIRDFDAMPRAAWIRKARNALDEHPNGTGGGKGGRKVRKRS